MLRVALLGEQAIVDDESGTVQSRSSRATALVGFLAAHPGLPQSRLRIASALWPESSDAQALTNLRRELHHLRRVPALADAVETTSDGLRLRSDSGCRIDLFTFESERAAALQAGDRADRTVFVRHGQAALAEYRGEFLPTCADEWAAAIRTGLEAEYVELCDLVCSALRASGELGAAVEVARRRIAARPLEEAGYLTLMQLQSLQGDRGAAVTTYHGAAAVLERELGIAPGAGLRAELQALMARDSAAPRAGARSPGTAAAPGHSDLIGRDTELAVIGGRWRRAAAGRATVVVFRGEAGVGKTRLLSELIALARRDGAVVATSRCFAATGRLGMASVADWLRDPALRAPVASLAPGERAEVARLLRAGEAANTGGDAHRLLADAWQRHRFFDALAAAFTATDRPTVLAVDDVQWCDRETLQFLAYLVRRRPGQPLLVAASLREDGTTAADVGLLRWLEELRRDNLLTEVPVGPLDAEATARIAESMSGRPLAGPDRALLHATTGGFPLYVVEAVRSSASVAGQGPATPGLDGVLRRRLEQAGDEAREVAALAATVGRNFTLELLTEASDLGVDVVVDAVDELWRRRILRESAGSYDFAHDLLRDAAYAQVPPARRWLQHRRVAQSLELLHGDDLDAVAVQIAGHYAVAGRLGPAVDYYRRAARVASDVFALADAVALYEQALAVIARLPAGPGRDRQELAVLEAMAAPLTAQLGFASPKLQAVLERTVALAADLHAGTSLLDGLAGLWGSRFVQGRTSDSLAVGRRALALTDPDSDRSASAHFAVGGTAISLGRAAEAVEHLPLVSALGGSANLLIIGTRPAVHSQAWLAHAYWLLARDTEALASARQAVECARGIDEPFSLAVALGYRAMTAQLQGRLDDMDDDVAELAELCDRYGFAYYSEWARVLRGWSEGGAAGLRLARAGVQTLKTTGAFARMPYWLTLLADLHAGTGSPDEAAATLDAALVIGRAHEDLWWLPEVLRRRARFDADSGDRLRAARAMAVEHGSVALIRRCEADLAALDVQVPSA